MARDTVDELKTRERSLRDYLSHLVRETSASASHTDRAMSCLMAVQGEIAQRIEELEDRRVECLAHLHADKRDRAHWAAKLEWGDRDLDRLREGYEDDD